MSEDLATWLAGQQPATPIASLLPSGAPASPPKPTPAVTAPTADPLAELAEFKRQAAEDRAARPNPLVPPRDPKDHPPTPSGDEVQDFVAQLAWERARRPNPLAP